MTKITRREFQQTFRNSQLNVQDTLQDSSVKNNLAKNGISARQLKKADLNGDGFVSGASEAKRLFQVIDKADHDGNSRSIETEARGGGLTSSGSLFSVLSAHIQAGRPEGTTSTAGVGSTRSTNTGEMPGMDFLFDGKWSSLKNINIHTKHAMERSYQDPNKYPKYKEYIQDAAKKYDLPPELIAGVIQKETRGRNIKGDRGHGRGLMQIDDRSYGPWLRKHHGGMDPKSNIDKGASKLRANIDRYAKKGLKGKKLLRAALAAYNCGSGNVDKALARGKDVDAYTHRGDYSKQVLLRTEYLHNKYPNLVR